MIKQNYIGKEMFSIPPVFLMSSYKVQINLVNEVSDVVCIYTFRE